MTNKEIENENEELLNNIEDDSEIKTNKDNKEPLTDNENDLETNTNNIQVIEENNGEDPYLKYITQIEQLQNELELEKNITNSLKNIGTSSEELIKLKQDLQENEQKLLQLKLTNKKQEEALNDLRKKISKEIPKIKSFTQNKYKKQNKNGDMVNNEAINIVLKVKDRELNDAIQKMNNLKKENQNLKNELYKNDDYNKKLEIKDTSKEYNDKIKELNTELKLINKQLAQHKICVEEQNKINNELNELKKKLKQLKTNTNENKNKIKEMQPNPYYISTEPNEKILFSNKLKNSNKKNNILSISGNKINNMSTIPATRKSNVVLPPITPRKGSQDKNNISVDQSILTADFIEKVKNYFGDKTEEFDTLLFKINEIENCWRTIESKHKTEWNQFNKQINTLDGQFQLLNNNGKANNSGIKILKNRLNLIKGQAKIQTRKYMVLKKEYDSLENISKEKDYEIALLLGQINSLRNLVNFTDNVMPEDKIDTYINQLKVEQKNENDGEGVGNLDEKLEIDNNSSLKSDNRKNEKEEKNKKEENNMVVNSYKNKNNKSNMNKNVNNAKIKIKNIGNKNKRFGFSDDKMDNGKK